MQNAKKFELNPVSVGGEQLLLLTEKQEECKMGQLCNGKEIYSIIFSINILLNVVLLIRIYGCVCVCACMYRYLCG